MLKSPRTSVASREFETSYTELMTMSPHAALIRFHARHDRLMEQVSDGSSLKKACAKNCAYCCHFKIVADAVEILAIADYVKTRLDPLQIDRLMTMAKQNAEETRCLSHREKSIINQQCPLLEANACLAYPVRTIKCRNFHAVSDSSCRASYEQPDDLSILNDNIPALYIAATGSAEGFMRALHLQGYDDRIYDFSAALLEALLDPVCKRRYDAGKRAFLTAAYNNA